MEELPHVLWTYWTTPCQSTDETPFSMTYGFEAVIPLEAGFPTLRTSLFTLNNNDWLLEKSLNLVDEQKEVAMVQLVHNQQKLKQVYDIGVKTRPLALADLMLRKVVGIAKKPILWKIGD